MTKLYGQLPKPNDGKEYRLCSKCSGNGLYVMAIVNGVPWSATGTTCWKCNGRGWVEKQHRQSKAKCPRCGGRFHVINGTIETHTVIYACGDQFVQETCRG